MAFSFTIFDDTDNGTVENLTPVYRFLEELGMRTTKSVWPLDGSGAVPALTGEGQRPEVAATQIGGQTLEDDPYRDFVLDLRARGFEIALHNVQNGSAVRARTREGLERYRAVFGEFPRLHANHSRNRENLYWGTERLSTLWPWFLFKLASFGKGRSFHGHVDGSDYFWGDMCREKITYVRNLVFDEINLNRVNPSMPYHDPHKPFVRYWFSSTDGADVERFCKAISEPNQERLEAEDGICIVYTHFASGFVQDGRLHQRFEDLMRRLAKRHGRFIPVGQLLDELLTQRGGKIPPAELSSMEWRWLREKRRKGRT